MEEAAAEEDASSSGGGDLLGASAAQPSRRRPGGEEDQTPIPHRRAGGPAAEAELHRAGGGAPEEPGAEGELQSETVSRRRGPGPWWLHGERLQRSEHDLHDQRGLLLRPHSGKTDMLTC